MGGTGDLFMEGRRGRRRSSRLKISVTEEKGGGFFEESVD